MEAKSIEEVAKMAAKEAVSEMKKQEKKERKATIFQNTKVLMENYNRMVKSVQEGISDLSDLTDESIEGLEEGENLFVESILRSKIRSLVMLAHIDKCLTMLENEEYDVGTPEKYLAFRYHYLDGMTYESISEVYNYSERTARRWVSELTNKMSIYLFGVDALLF